MENEKTTLWISRDTRDRLAKRGEKDDTFDLIINSLLDKTEKSITAEEYEVSNLFGVKDKSFNMLKLPQIYVIKARVSKAAPLTMFFLSKGKRFWIKDTELRRRLEKFLKEDYEGE